MLGNHSISVLDGPYTTGDVATQAARDFALELLSMLQHLKKFATQELLETYNDSWADTEHEKLTAERFEANLKSPQIVIYDELGAAAVYFDDSDMFGGHSINVSINGGKVLDASL